MRTDVPVPAETKANRPKRRNVAAIANAACVGIESGPLRPIGASALRVMRNTSNDQGWCALGRQFVERGFCVAHTNRTLAEVVGDLSDHWMAAHLGACEVIELHPMISIDDDDSAMMFQMDGSYVGCERTFNMQLLNRIKKQDPRLLATIMKALDVASSRVVPLLTPTECFHRVASVRWLHATNNASWEEEVKSVYEGEEIEDVLSDGGPDSYVKAFGPDSWLLGKNISEALSLSELKTLSKKCTGKDGALVGTLIGLLEWANAKAFEHRQFNSPSLNTDNQYIESRVGVVATLYPTSQLAIDATAHGIDEFLDIETQGDASECLWKWNFNQGSYAEFFKTHENAFQGIRIVDRLLSLISRPIEEK